MQNNPIEPPFRCGTGHAILSLKELLQLDYHPNMQDWSYEIANPKDIEQYLALYPLVDNDDELFVLMEIMIQAVEEQDPQDFDYYWNKIKLLLQQDFKIHQYTIFYWCCFDNDNLEDCFVISKNMRTLWFETTNL